MDDNQLASPILNVPQEIFDRIIAHTLPHPTEVKSSRMFVNFVRANLVNKEFYEAAKRTIQMEYEHELRLTATVISDRRNLMVMPDLSFNERRTAMVYVSGKIAYPTASSCTLTKIKVVLFLGTNLFLSKDYGKVPILDTIIREINPYGWLKTRRCLVTIKIASIFSNAIKTVRNHLETHLPTLQIESKRRLLFKYEEYHMTVGQNMTDIASPVPNVESPPQPLERWVNIHSGHPLPLH